MLIGPITIERTKRIEDTFIGLIHDIWIELASRIFFKMTSNMKLNSKKDQVLINVIQAKYEEVV